MSNVFHKRRQNVDRLQYSTLTKRRINQTSQTVTLVKMSYQWKAFLANSQKPFYENHAWNDLPIELGSWLIFFGSVSGYSTVG